MIAVPEVLRDELEHFERFESKRENEEERTRYYGDLDTRTATMT